MPRLCNFAALLIGSTIISALPVTASMGAEGDRFEPFDKSKFSNPTVIDNRYLPLKPGMQLTYDGVTGEGEEEKEHQIIFTVTDLVKEIDGVPVVVIWERDISEDFLLEAELAFFAQDDDGNVWYFGELSEAYDETEFVGGRAWLVGHLEGARAGIKMKAKPEVTGEDYSQGFAPPPYNWTDRAKTIEVGAQDTVPAGSFSDVIVSEEYNDEEPGAVQLKYYAPDVGVIRVGWTGDDSNKEVLELVEFKQLTPEELDEAREEALKLETRAYVYGNTPPARLRGDGM